MSQADRAAAATAAHQLQGVRLPLPAEGAVRECVAEIACGALALARAVGQPPTALEEARTDFESTAAKLRETLRSSGHFKPTMAETDAQARSLLVSGICVSKDGTKLQAPQKCSREARAIAKTHGHLFRRLRL